MREAAAGGLLQAQDDLVVEWDDAINLGDVEYFNVAWLASIFDHA
jgi:hypothetical protein